MAYTGSKVYIPLGALGQRTDESPDKLPLGCLSLANNVSFERGWIEKDYGSKRWNATAMGSGVAAFHDWFPNASTQRIIAITQSGAVKRFTDFMTSFDLTLDSENEPATLNVTDQVSMIEGGLESEGNDKKLFILTGNDPIQVISGDATERYNLTLPAVDWTTNSRYPSIGIIHRGRFWTFFGHRGYASTTDNHEDFQGAGILTSSIYPGEGDRIFACWTFKGRLFVAKSPSSVYYLVDNEVDDSQSYWLKLNVNFGAASPHSAIEAKDDALIANSTGSITSTAAAFQLGDIESADLLSEMGIEGYMQENFSELGNRDRWAVYYESKKRAYFTYRSKSGIRNDTMLVIDVSKKDVTKAAWNTKDQPSCLGLITDRSGVRRPFYGADDGFIYEMDSPDRAIVTSSAAGYQMMFQTHFSDLGVDQDKDFDFLELDFIPTGNFVLSVDVFIDNKFSETLQFRCGNVSNRLGTFILDRSRLGGISPKTQAKQLHGRGRTISFRCYNSNLRENFKIKGMRVFFRGGGEDQKG